MGAIEQAGRLGTGEEHRGEPVEQRAEVLDAGVIPLSGAGVTIPGDDKVVNRGTNGGVRALLHGGRSGLGSLGHECCHAVSRPGEARRRQVVRQAVSPGRLRSPGSPARPPTGCCRHGR